jgi:hypothetical protein
VKRGLGHDPLSLERRETCWKIPGELNIEASIQNGSALGDLFAAVVEVIDQDVVADVVG